MLRVFYYLILRAEITEVMNSEVVRIWKKASWHI